MHRFAGSVLIAVLAFATPVLAQSSPRPAISPSLSPRDVAVAFADAVVEICAPAVIAGRGLSATSGISRATDADAARQVGAEPGDTVWEMAAARGVVRLREHGGRCMVSAYGPPAAPALAEAARRLAASGLGFERLAPTPGRLGESLARVGSGRRVQVMLGGSEPGMPGHQSRFSVLTATVFAIPE